VLRTAVELGVNHIDTADAYGPYITNRADAAVLAATASQDIAYVP
jgi:pyridoxine 4-dehydrogenase